MGLFVSFLSLHQNKCHSTGNSLISQNDKDECGDISSLRSLCMLFYSTYVCVMCSLRHVSLKDHAVHKVVYVYVCGGVGVDNCSSNSRL